MEHFAQILTTFKKYLIRKIINSLRSTNIVLVTIQNDQWCMFFKEISLKKLSLLLTIVAK
jgi:hypothetical protein